MEEIVTYPINLYVFSYRFLRVASRNCILAHVTNFYVNVELGCRRSSGYIQQASKYFRFLSQRNHQSKCTLLTILFMHVVSGKWQLA